jgi:hypothetical protein
MKTVKLAPVRGIEQSLFKEVNKKRISMGTTWRGLITQLFKDYLLK